jgi:hypothetical protein
MTDFLQGNTTLIVKAGQGALAEPRHVPKSAWLGHIPFAFWLVERLRPNKIVELGTHTGASYFAFCQAVDELKMLTTCYAVDTWKGDEHAGFYDESVFRSVQVINSSQYSGFSQLLRMTFDEAREDIGDGSIDLLHIDGLHTYEAVRHDFERWLPTLSDRAVVLLHDTRITRSEFGVYRFFAELSERYPCFEFLHSAGLGVVFVGKAHDPNILAALTGEGSTQTTDVTRMLFRRLGERIELSYRLDGRGGDDAQARLKEVEAKSAEKVEAIKRRDAEILGLKEKLVADTDSARLLQNEIDQLLITAARREKEFERQTADLTKVADLLIVTESRLKELEAKSAEKVEAIERRNAEILGLKEKLATETDAARLLRGEMDQMKIISARREKEFERQTSDLAKVEDLLIETLAEKERIEEIIRAERALRTFLYVHSKRRLEPLRYRMSVRKALGLLKNSGDFDVEWYLARYPDVKKSGVDPIQHYYFSGVFEGRNPSAGFNTLQYLLAHPDVAKAGINPLLHYVRVGKRENRKVERADNGE